jgi:hypothetical protein
VGFDHVASLIVNANYGHSQGDSNVTGGGVAAAVAGYLSADASLRRLSRICAGVQAANPKTNAGFSFASMQKKKTTLLV